MADVIIVNEVQVVTTDDTKVEVITVGIQGPAGADGAPGEQGPQGIQGIQGPAGNDGEDGDAADIALEIDNAAAENPLLDTDSIPFTRTNVLKKGLWSSFKTTLKTYFDGLYLALSGGTLTGDLNTKKIIYENIGEAVTDNSPLIIETAVDIRNVATTALYIYPKDTAQHRLFLGRSGKELYALDLQYCNSVYLPPTMLGLKGGGNNSDALALGSVIVGAGIRRRGNSFADGTRNEVDIFASDNASNGCSINFFLSPSAFYSVNQKDLTGWICSIRPTGFITDKDVEITDFTKGVILASPDGSRFRITIENDGTLTSTLI